MPKNFKIVGALPPPFGVEPDYDKTTSKQIASIVLQAVFLTLVTLAVVLRVYVRLRLVKHKLYTDDVLCLCSWALSVAFSGLVLKSMELGVSRHMWDTPAHYIPLCLKYYTVASWVYTVLVAMVRLTILALYHRLFSVSRSARWWIRSGIVLVIATNLTCLLLLIFRCTPFKLLWERVGPGHCIAPAIIPYLSGVSSLVSDLYILILPVPILWNMNTTRKRKARLFFLFGLGSLACAAAVVRLVLTPRIYTDSDYTWNVSDVTMCAIIECNIGIICTCLTSMPKFVKYHFTSLNRSHWVKLLSGVFSGSSRREAYSGSVSSNAKFKEHPYKNMGGRDDPASIELQTRHAATKPTSIFRSTAELIEP